MEGPPAAPAIRPARRLLARVAAAAILLQPLRRRDYRLLWTGSVVSVFGDQFYLVALPWLVLELTGSGFAVGTTLMLAGIPRAVLLLAGGVASDRLAPRRILLVTMVARGVLVGSVGWLVAAGAAQMVHIYALVFLFGVADAFAYPAFASLIPRLVPAGELPAANGLLQGASHTALFAGPVLGGLLIASGGLSAAFVLDALSFLFAWAMLALMSRGSPAGAVQPEGSRPERGLSRTARLAGQVAEGLRAVWRDPPMRAIVLLIAAVNLAFAGPFGVGLPAMAKREFQSATALGVMFSGFGGGALAGAALAGAVGRSVRLAARVLVPCFVFSLAFLTLAATRHLAAATAVTATLGLAGGFINVLLFSWLQQRSRPELLGRVMSLVIFASVGLQPISFAVAGGLVDAHLRAMFVGAGLLMASGTLWVMAAGVLKDMHLAATPADA